MLKLFRIENYKSFRSPLTIDFSKVGGYQFSESCVTDNLITKMLIYGRNATGKTNLGSAICDIAYATAYLVRYDDTAFLNADSESNAASFSYCFQFNQSEIEYTYAKSSLSHYLTEVLRINGQEIFNFDYVTDKYQCNNLELISSETIQVDRFLEALHDDSLEGDTAERTICFLRWLFANSAYDNNSIFAQMRRFIGGMRLMSASALSQKRFIQSTTFSRELEGENLQKLEQFLNKMGVECKLEIKKLPDGRIELYFKKAKKLIPFFDAASSGTIALYNLYFRFIARMQNLSFCYFDEFDAFFHYELSERFVRFFQQEFPNCQVIFTTHNTNLMSNDIMRPDCLFILSSDGRLTPLNEATARELREGHNLEKMYISGEFKNYE